MKKSEEQLESLGIPETDTVTESEKRFADGAQYRIEIPSTEGPVVLEEVLSEADKLGCPVHRVSQGSGIQMLSDEEIRAMARIGSDHGIEVSLFVTPRAGFETGGLWNAPAGRMIQWQNRGADQLRYALDDINRAVDLGIRSVLLADYGLIRLVSDLKSRGSLPSNLLIKTSAVLCPANPASAQLLQELGASTINVATDLEISKLATIRRCVDVPLDIYVEAPDGLGGFVRHHEVPKMIATSAPIYVKLGLRNAPDIYPSGEHLESTALALGRERVRRSKLVYELIQREMPEAVISETGPQSDLGVPEI